MKKVLSIVLLLALVLSMSATAFAGGSVGAAGGSGSQTTYDSPTPSKKSEPDVYKTGSDPVPVTDPDADLKDVNMPKDVSVDDDDVIVDRLANSPANIKEEAKKELAELKRNGYKIDCGFGAWSKSGKTLSCTIKLSKNDVPSGSDIFVNGVKVEPAVDGGYYVFPVNLPAVILVAHK